MLVEGYPKQGAGHLKHAGCGLQLLEEFCGQTLTFLVTSGKLSLKEGLNQYLYLLTIIYMLQCIQ